MKTHSPLFDRIRVKPDKDRRLRAQCPACEWPDCQAPATHRAPKGRLREREYWCFCLEHVHDPFSLFRDFDAGAQTRSSPRHARPVRNAERKALDALGLEPQASSQQVKRRFKELVKRHHPDANGGDRSSEARLREIIQAYNYLKSIGFR
jgi:hypothetical protein